MSIHTSRYRLRHPSPKSPSLLQTTSTTLLHLSPTHVPSIPSLSSLPHSLHLPVFSLPSLLSLPPTISATTPSTFPPPPNSLSLNPNSLLLTLDRNTFTSLGLATFHKLKPPQQMKATTRKRPMFIPVEIGRGVKSEKVKNREVWALNEERIGGADIYVSGAKEDLEGIGWKYSSDLKQINEEVTNGQIGIDQVPNFDACDWLEGMDCVQRLCTQKRFCRNGTGEFWRVQRRKYVGYCDGQVGKKGVDLMRKRVAEVGGVGVVLIRGVGGAGRIWKGEVRGGVGDGFGGEAGECWVFGRWGELMMEMRGVVDEFSG